MNARIVRPFLAALALAALAGPAAAQAPAPAAPPAPVAAPTKKPEPSPESVKEGKALFAKFVESLGGPAKVRTVHDVQTRGLVTAKGPEGDMSMEVQTSMVFPDRIAQQLDAPFGRMAMVATPTGAFIVGTQRRPGPPAGHEGRAAQAGAARPAAHRAEGRRPEARGLGGRHREDRRRRSAHPRRRVRRRVGPLVPGSHDVPHPALGPHVGRPAGRGEHRLGVLRLQGRWTDSPSPSTSR